MSYGISVSVGFPSDYERLVALSVADASEIFPNQVGAIAMLAEAAHAKWLAYASGNETTPSGKKINARTGNYMNSIKLEQTPEGYSIYSDLDMAPYARVIEDGASAFDMHALLQTSDKTRISKAGKKYLIIPFRHGSPDSLVVGAYTGRAMPDDVYGRMSSSAQSFVSGSYQEQSVNSDNMTTRLTYDWGSKLTLGDLTQAGYDPTERQTQNMVGMARMASNTDKATSSVYVTFRVLSEDSDGWVIPEREGAEPAKAVYEWLQKNQQDIMSKALEADIKRLEGLVGFG